MPTALILTTASALLYAASQPPLMLAPLAWIALVPLLAAVLRVGPVRAAGLGALWGVGVGFASGWVLPGMLASYFNLQVVLAWTGAILLYLLLAGVQAAAFAAWMAWLGRRRPIGPLLLAAAWGTTELARAHSPLGCPWVLLGYSQVPFTHLVQVADLAGPYGIGMLVAGGNGVIGGLFLPALRGRWPKVERIGLPALVIASVAYGHWRLMTPFGTGTQVPVAVVQGNVERGFQWQPEYAQVGVDRYVALTRDLAAGHPRLVVWPEHAVSFYLQEPRAETSAVFGVARDLATDLVLGGPHYTNGARDTIYHNSVFVIRRGRLAGRYDKLRLVPVAEESVGGFAPLQTPYTPGAGIRVLDTGAGHVGPLICWEVMYPELVRRVAVAGADVLVNVSNDWWFGKAAQARHHLHFGVLRAIENRRWLVRAAQTGISAVIDPWGRVVTESRFGEPATLQATIEPSEAGTPYQRWGDTLAWAAVAWTLAATAGSLARRQAPDASRTRPA